MNLVLDYRGFENDLLERKESVIPNTEAVQYLFRFDNNYGASVVKHEDSYGSSQDLWELAAILYYEDNEFKLSSWTPIGKDTLGYLTDDQVREALGKIKRMRIV